MDTQEMKIRRGVAWERVEIEPRHVEPIARAFHQAYEEAAPELGYETREDSAVPWDQVPFKNRTLMITTVQRLLEAGIITFGPNWSPDD